MEQEMQEELDKQAADARGMIARLEETYEKQHKLYAESLFRSMIKEEPMGSLIHYSGISTKIRAMERWRIKPEQFEQMAALESVPEAVRFLRSLPPYEKIFSGVEDKELHRGGLNSF